MLKNIQEYLKKKGNINYRLNLFFFFNCTVFSDLQSFCHKSGQVCKQTPKASGFKTYTCEPPANQNLAAPFICRLFHRCLQQNFLHRRDHQRQQSMFWYSDQTQTSGQKTTVPHSLLLKILSSSYNVISQIINSYRKCSSL